MPYIVLPDAAELLRDRRVRLSRNAVPAAKGRYFFGDNCNERDPQHVAGRRERLVPTSRSRWTGLSAFGEDAKGELYLASVQSGNVYGRLGRS